MTVKETKGFQTSRERMTAMEEERTSKKPEKQVTRSETIKRAMEPEQAIAQLRQCATDGNAPDVFMYNEVLKKIMNIHKKKMSYMCLKLFLEMIEITKLQPNIVVFCSLLDVLYHDKRYHDILTLCKHWCFADICIEFLETKSNQKTACSHYHRYENTEIETMLGSLNNMAITPNQMLYNILIKTFGKLKWWNQIAPLLELMTGHHKLGPTLSTLNSVITAYALNQRIIEIEQLYMGWLQRSHEFPFDMDIITINSILKGYKLSSSPTCFYDAEKVFLRHCGHKLFAACSSQSPDQMLSLTQAQQTYIQNYFQNQTFGDDFLSPRYLVPNPFTFSFLISCAAQCGFADRALFYFNVRELIYNVADIDLICRSAVMNACLMARDCATVLDCSETYNKPCYVIAIRALFVQDRIDDALSVFDAGFEMGLLPYLERERSDLFCMDVHHYDLIISIIAVMHNLRQLCDALKLDIKPNIKNNLSIIVGKGVNREGNRHPLHVELPKALKNKKFFDPPLQYRYEENNIGKLFIDNHSLVEYISYHLNEDKQKIHQKLFE
ncbi:hypothetical protein RFI_23090 [Reticulomyxa filosa]|uniref:Pentatricopeptide repeat-containing protein n=1 Tax=Reticulomyxa filosa TaxID=46433 RepID=X6MLE8_RETFI|nr:hypothetical protein RFI_23090 [Reticulomyxa filosa]|eukprot:ETO14277.1 hypothetical protein RFI_23090 [Reticulomyxa filosa]